MESYKKARNLLKFILFLQMMFLFSKINAGDVKLTTGSGLIVPKSNDEKSASCHGAPGLPGRDGRDGRDASLLGLPGKPGKTGPQGPPGPKGKAGGSTGGVVYTRWGRKKCPTTSKTTLLYSGVMGGSHYSHHGGGANYLCLPNNPIYEKTVSGHQGSTYIYGTEYEVAMGSQVNIFPKNLQNQDAPCAVCHAESRGSHVMIPARNVCPSGWTLEYKGYLMAAHHGHQGSTQFICVDSNPTSVDRSYTDQNGALLYFVEGACGSLPCGPYADGSELTCAVCTK